MYRLAAAVLASAALATFAAEGDLHVVIENHKFAPDRIEVPAGQKVKLTIENRDGTPEEFESNDMRIEKVIPGKSKGVVWLGPLKAGEYKFFGEYHEKTAQGIVVAK